MYILGIGIVFAGGRGINSYEQALLNGWQRPSEIRLKNGSNLAYLVDIENIKDVNLWKKMRRSDKFSKMAVLAAADALADGKLTDKENLGIIAASALGPHVTTFNFLDDILDYGDTSVSPFKFSNSVHNAAASYIAEVLNIQGPSLSVTHFNFSFQYAMQLAQVWLDENRCDKILVGVAEEYGNVLDYALKQKLNPALDGKIKPFNFSPAYYIPGEGAVFFLVGKNVSENSYCSIEKISFKVIPDKQDLNIIDTDGTLSDESIYKSALSTDVPVASYTPLYGSMLTGSAFNCATGVLSLKNQTRYANPVADNPHGLNLVDSGLSKLERISCIKYDCNKFNSIIALRKNTLSNY